MRYRVLPFVLSLLAGIFSAPLGAFAQIAPAHQGDPLPMAARKVLQRDPEAYQMRRAWIEKTRQLRQLRETALKDGNLKAAGSYKVSGTFNIPIFTVTFANSPGQPYPSSDLQSEIFGPSPGVYDLTEFYSEISYGNITATGTVFDWVALPQNDTYYEGGVNGLDPAQAKVGELIKAALDAYDTTIDFGQFDNDGPDGVPNSGDDDGYVDFVAFVQPEQGGECGNSNIWSHRWVYRAWNASGGSPYQTNDASANGGNILVDDYTIQPAFSCAGPTTMIEIGVFCHEFGHAFGLPDLYDTNGGSSEGLGHWGLMAAGNWNAPTSPAHMSVWSKAELGWLTPVEVGWQGTVLDIPPVETYPVAYALSFTDDRWSRRTDCALNGTSSLTVGLDNSRAAARGWVANRGYGNAWRETVAHDFHFDGSGPVTLSFSYRKDSEGGYDFTYCILEVGGSETLLRAYDGLGTGTENFDLTSLLGASPTDYRVKFRFTSDVGWSDEDGNYDCVCAPFVVDDLAVSGGGENYFTDFENHLDGWYQPPDPFDNPVSEKWLVENRQRLGSELSLHGEGLAIYHVDQEVIHSALGNSGGSTEGVVRGVVVEEADGRADLLAGVNRGDGGDVWPGSSANTAFDRNSNPNTLSNTNDSTLVEVTAITAIGDTMNARLVGGDPPPGLSSVDPVSASVGTGVLALDLGGETHVRHGATVTLVQSGQPDVVATVSWCDFDTIGVSVDLSSAAAGVYDVVLMNPDGQTAVLPGAFTVVGATGVEDLPARPAATSLAQNYPNPFNPSTTIRYQLDRAAHARLTILDVRGRVVRRLVDEPKEAGWYSILWNGTDDAGRPVASGLYFYRLAAGDFVGQKKLLLVK